MKKKIIFLGVIVIMAVCVFCGCDKNEYNAQIYDNVNELISQDFSSKNYTYGAYLGDLYLGENSYPNSKTFLIDNVSLFEEIFDTNQKIIDADFEKEIIILYTFTATNIKEITLKKISLSNGVLSVELEKENSNIGVGDTVRPYQRYVLIKLTKLDITDIQVI